MSESGHVYSMGSNSHGQLGIGDLAHKNTPSLVESAALLESMVTKVACGMYHSIALTSNQTAFAWGQGRLGALGNGRSEN